MDFWNLLHNKLEENENIILMIVGDSNGSSPGRQGFKMAVCEKGDFFGSIGGGIMEHKLVEYCKSLFDDWKIKPILKRQIHRSEEVSDRSGMICSGEQTVLFYPIDSSDRSMIKELTERHHAKQLFGDSTTLKLASNSKAPDGLAVFEDQWTYSENLNVYPRAFVFGGGHVGVAISKLLAALKFQTTLLDDRKGLNTMESVDWCDQKIIDYNDLGLLNLRKEDYIIVASFGYRSDKLIMKQLIGSEFLYFGVMGSQSKMKTLLAELIDEGFAREDLEKIKTPIGIPIHSKTPDEIAVSVAAEIIATKNKSQ